MSNNLDAYAIFIALVLSFIPKLDPLSSTFANVEAEVCATLLPGPAEWISHCFLKTLKAAHFPKEVLDIMWSSVAARARAAQFEDSADGGFCVLQRAARLRQAMSQPGDDALTQAWFDYTQE
ncbi:unnamed protein product [Prorocentrum cordatum]|uniref:Uncharacterized protein n=1 Tax=Prorocentrum cordatum TaxID=2364126 RepID=A0ABN9TN19_9DINO|nr:unnamed protein product [Polarella glacialis]